MPSTARACAFVCLKQQAQAGDIVLLFQDESEALTHPYLAHAWAKRGADLRVEAPGQARKVAMIGALDFAAGTLVVETSRTKRSSDFIALLTRLDEIYGPRPGRQTKPGRPRHRQRSHPYQQGVARRARSAALAERRMAAEVRPRTERHRTCLARPQTAFPRPSNLSRPRSSRPSHPCRRRRPQQGAPIQNVCKPANRCLADGFLERLSPMSVFKRRRLYRTYSCSVRNICYNARRAALALDNSETRAAMA